MATRRADERIGRPAPERHRVRGPAVASCAHPVLELQRLAGNHAVARLIGTVTIARQPAKKAASAPQRFSLGENGAVLLDDGGTSVRVGTVDAAGAWVAVDDKNRAVAVDNATIGTVEPGPDRPDAAIVRARRATVKATTTATATTPGADPDLSQGTPVEVKLTGSRCGVIYDIGTAVFGATLLAGGTGGWTVVDFAKLPEGLRATLSAAPSARIALDGGDFWSLMSFHLRGERADGARWVPAETGTKAVKKGLEKDAGKLPPDLQARFSEYLGVVTAVMAHEGSYGDESGPGDEKASIGIFQWAMNKSGAQGAGSSMGMFFKDLKRRAAAAAKAGAAPTPEQKLYIDAWEQCRRAGLDVDAAGTVSLNGKQATGGQVEGVMAGSGPMSRGALKTYQLVAAMDWIENFRGTLVRPGVRGASWIGNGYAETGNGSAVTLVRADGGTTYRFSLVAPDITASVGDLLSSARSTAMAVTLGVNRPHFVETALWRAVSNRADPKADASALLAQLVTALRAAEPRRLKTRAVTAADAEALGDDAAADWAELQRLIWPAPAEFDDEAEQRLTAEFERRALKLYEESRDPRGHHRERRFATAEAVFQ